MKFLTLHSLDGAIPRNHRVAFAYAPWFDSQYVTDDIIIMLHDRGDLLSGDNYLFALVCEDF